MPPKIPPQARQAGVSSSAAAVHAVSRRWLSFLGSKTDIMKIIPALSTLITVVFLAGCSTTSPHPDAIILPPTPIEAVLLAPPQSTKASQAARNFLETVRNEDWNAVAKFWPPNAQKRFDDIFTEPTKGHVGGLEIVSLGKPYKERWHTWVFVPYIVQFKNGGIQTNNLRIEKQADGHWIWESGF